MSKQDYVNKARRMNQLAMKPSPIKGFADKCRYARDFAMRQARCCK